MLFLSRSLTYRRVIYVVCQTKAILLDAATTNDVKARNCVYFQHLLDRERINGARDRKLYPATITRLQLGVVF